MMAVPSGGCDSKEESVGGEDEEEAGDDGQGGIKAEQIVEGASTVAFGDGRGHCDLLRGRREANVGKLLS